MMDIFKMDIVEVVSTCIDVVDRLKTWIKVCEKKESFGYGF
ncbi:MAG: hypothetical protein QW547_04790 [Candidatus Bathyarchaeia archaeon]